MLGGGKTESDAASPAASTRFAGASKTCLIGTIPGTRIPPGLSRFGVLAWRAVAGLGNFCYLSPMILRAGQVIAGRPAKDIRKLLREIRHLQVSSAYVRDVL